MKMNDFCLLPLTTGSDDRCLDGQRALQLNNNNDHCFERSTFDTFLFKKSLLNKTMEFCISISRDLK